MSALLSVKHTVSLMFLALRRMNLNPPIPRSYVYPSAALFAWLPWTELLFQARLLFVLTSVYLDLTWAALYAYVYTYVHAHTRFPLMCGQFSEFVRCCTLPESLPLPSKHYLLHMGQAEERLIHVILQWITLLYSPDYGA
jgi:hypothetical protein